MWLLGFREACWESGHQEPPTALWTTGRQEEQGPERRKWLGIAKRVPREEKLWHPKGPEG